MTKFFRDNNLRLLDFTGCDDEDIAYPYKEDKKLHNCRKQCFCMEGYDYLYQFLVTDILNTDEYYIPDAQIYEYKFFVSEFFYYGYTGCDLFCKYCEDDSIKISEFKIIDDIQNYINKKTLYKYNLYKEDPDKKYKKNHVTPLTMQQKPQKPRNNNNKSNRNNKSK